MKPYVLLLALLLTACGGPKPHTSRQHAYEVKTEVVHKTLHFTGTVQPLHEMTLVSPIDAVVQTMKRRYGSMVHQGDVVMTLHSTELQKQFNDTLTEYLKAKDNFSMTQSKFIGTQELWDAGLISKNNYLSEQSGLTNARVSLLQARRKLSELLEKLEDKNLRQVEQLNLTDFNEVKKALATAHHTIHLKAPGDGLLLYPPKTTDDKTARISTGSVVKQGQAVALIGDLTGISLEIDIPEIDIDKIKPGLKASVTGVAFGHRELQGKVVAVNAQASNTGGGLPSFSAVVEVDALTPEEQSFIKVGMSAAIEVHVDDLEQLLVPIAAITREQGKSTVRVLEADGREVTKTIVTGAAQADSVVVLAGLKPKDTVVYD